jgi:hypothetical protein
MVQNLGGLAQRCCAVGGNTAHNALGVRWMRPGDLAYRALDFTAIQWQDKDILVRRHVLELTLDRRPEPVGW